MSDLITDVGTITATWTDPAGTVWPLSDTSDDVGWFTTPGPAGWHATSYEIVTDPLAGGGSQVRYLRANPGRITWPIYVWGDTHLQYVARHRQIRRAFTMTAHRKLPGILSVQRPDLSARTVECYYQGGLEGEAGEGWLFSKDAVTLFCPDGYWKDTVPVTLTQSYAPGVDFLDPFPSVSEGLALGAAQLTNPGDVEAWPTWTLTGPMSSFSATNVTLGYEFTLTWPLAAGHQITIVTERNRPQVRSPTGDNLVSALNWPTAVLWPVAPGANSLIYNVAGADTGTQVDLAFYPRYEGA